MSSESPGDMVHSAPVGTLRLVADLFAEEHVLLEWAETSSHPRLAVAYRSLHDRIASRCKDVRTAWEARHPDARSALLDATLTALETTRGVSFELSRIKHLLAARRERTVHETIPGYDAHRGAEDQEAETLQRLLSELARGMC